MFRNDVLIATSDLDTRQFFPVRISGLTVKGSPDPRHIIFEINVGTWRIRQRTTLNLNDVNFNRFLVDLEIHHSIPETFYVGSVSFRH